MKKEDRNAILGVVVAVILGILIAFAGSQQSVSIARIPLFALSVGLAYLIQWIVFVPSFLNKTEHFFDLTGSISYMSIFIITLLLSKKSDFRSILVSVLVIIWAARLGAFLFARVRRAGEDKRFRELKQSFPRFLQTWTLQGLWITFTLAAALAVLTSSTVVPFDAYALVGLLVWLVGFAFEAIADNQKKDFKADPGNDGKFISSGLWSWSRHPNYFGEIVLWIGIAIIALPVLRGWQWVTLISPVFVIILLTKFSGIPILEKRADVKWGDQEVYQNYKTNTSVLLPLPPKKKV